MSNLGYLSLILGDYQTAEQMSLEAVELKRELGNEIGAIESLCNAGLAALLGLRLDDARGLLNDTLRVSLDLGHDTLIACSLEGFAWMAARSSEFERAARLQGAAESRMTAAGGDLDGVEQKIHDETRTAIRGAWAGAAMTSSRLAGRSASRMLSGSHSRADLPRTQAPVRGTFANTDAGPSECVLAYLIHATHRGRPAERCQAWALPP